MTERVEAPVVAPPAPAAGAQEGGGPRVPALVPGFALVLLGMAVVAVVLAFRARHQWHEAAAREAMTAELQRQLAFALLFNVGTAAALAIAWLADLVGDVVRLVLRRSPGRVLVRLVVVSLPLLAFGVGHQHWNPWLAALVGDLAPHVFR